MYSKKQEINAMSTTNLYEKDEKFTFFGFVTRAEKDRCTLKDVEKTN